MTRKLIQILFLMVLALVAIPIGIAFTIAEGILFTANNIFRSIWSLINGFFFALSKIVSVCAGKFLTKALTKRGVPFGVHSISAVLGANLRERTLSRLGIWLVKTLDSIDTNHCRRASEKAGI